ncbi:MAG: fumarylacetoacetate hydrolase family protein [Acidimicrobiia bacterium]|nr:fumarylacetoacetate hydrolase family protein [Acidimicrobiia bacterium]
MRLYTFGVASPIGSQARIGAEAGGRLIDLNAACAALFAHQGEPDAVEYAAFLVPPDMVGYLSRGDKARQAAQEALEFAAEGAVAAPDGARLAYDFAEVRLLAPVPRPPLVRDASAFLGHVRFGRACVSGQRSIADVPPDAPGPANFHKFPPYFHQSGAITAGPYDPIVKPRFTEQLDFEFELGVYVGRKGINLPAAEAERYIAGITIYNDVSARDVQWQEMDLFLGPAKGKNFEGANIMGPCLVTLDEIDPTNLRMVARVNGEVVVDDHSSGMTHTFPRILEYISQEEYLYPGDFIASGTCDHGTCLTSTLQRWLQVGDVVEFEVEGIGTIRNEVVPSPRA